MILTREDLKRLYAAAEATREHGANHIMDAEPALVARLVAYMRPFCPLPGDEYWKMATVLLEPGGCVKDHVHQEHVVVYYPGPEKPGPLMMGSREVQVSPGDCVYIPPGQYHSVPKTTERRLSVAILIK